MVLDIKLFIQSACQQFSCFAFLRFNIALLMLVFDVSDQERSAEVREDDLSSDAGSFLSPQDGAAVPDDQ